MGHARALAGVTDLPLQLSLHKQVVDKGLSVRALETLIRTYQESHGHESGRRLHRIRKSVASRILCHHCLEQKWQSSGMQKAPVRSRSTSLRIRDSNEILDILEKIE